jgi:hypothetical protein
MLSPNAGANPRGPARLSLPSCTSELLDKVTSVLKLEGYVTLALEDHKRNGEKSDYRPDEALVISSNRL